MSSVPSPFEELRQGFWRHHHQAILRGLDRCFEGPVRVTPTPLASEVQERFLRGCRDFGVDPSDPRLRHSARLQPTFHGTDASLHESIFAMGLLIPGEGNSLAVRNGSAHGVGIYTATVHKAWLSKSFCSAPRMLVCGVLDDAVPLTRSRVLGRRNVIAESQAVRHVGDAVVVFDTKRVVPLFEASGTHFRTQEACDNSGWLPAKKPRGNEVVLYWQEVRAAAAEPRREKRLRSAPTSFVRLDGVNAFLARRAARRRRPGGS